MYLVSTPYWFPYSWRDPFLWSKRFSPIAQVWVTADVLLLLTYFSTSATSFIWVEETFFPFSSLRDNTSFLIMWWVCANPHSYNIYWAHTCYPCLYLQYIQECRVHVYLLYDPLLCPCNNICHHVCRLHDPDLHIVHPKHFQHFHWGLNKLCPVQIRNIKIDQGYHFQR